MVFNSLGSNYNIFFTLKALTSINSRAHKRRLKHLLEEKYGGKVVLLYKGREAIRLALRSINDTSLVVGICGFTCYAVYEAAKREGYKVEYIDIEAGELHFSPEKFSQAIKRNPKIGILIIQNTLGYPCEMEEIAKICKERKIILIEDLAHSVGARYEYGTEAGTIGEFAALSFSQDKMIDGITGGALVIRNKKYYGSRQDLSKIPLKKQVVDKLYPFFTYLIRRFYNVGGKGLHYLLKKMDLLALPMNDLSHDLHKLPTWYSNLIFGEMKDIQQNIFYRRKIATIYKVGLNKKVLLPKVMSKLKLSSNLRFPIVVNDRGKLVGYLKKNGIFVSDIWYDAPIAPKKFLHLTDYNRSCPNSENLSQMILNLPTHKNVSENEAERIVEKINEWLEKNG